MLGCFVDDMSYIRKLRISGLHVALSIGKLNAIFVQIDDNFDARVPAMNVRRLVFVCIRRTVLHRR